MLARQIQPYSNHLDESHRFTSAIVYLLAANDLSQEMPETALGLHHQKFQKSLSGSYETPRSYFMAQLFVARVACFEQFLQETVSLVIEEHPKKG